CLISIFKFLRAWKARIRSKAGHGDQTGWLEKVQGGSEKVHFGSLENHRKGCRGRVARQGCKQAYQELNRQRMEAIKV
ncbi:hypothetical protein M8C21_003701, partial [Ambrosia artemisiifolia]